MPGLAEIFAALNASATGSATYARTRASTPAEQGAAAAGSHEVAAQQASDWSLEAALGIKAGGSVGVKIGGGVIQKQFQLTCELGRLSGIRFENGQMSSDLSWTWAAPLQAMFAEVQSRIEQAKHILSLPAEAAEEAWQGLATAGGWVYHGIENAGRAVRDGAYAVGQDVRDGASAGRGVRDTTYAAGQAISNTWNSLTSPSADPADRQSPSPLDNQFVWGY